MTVQPSIIEHDGERWIHERWIKATWPVQTCRRCGEPYPQHDKRQVYCTPRCGNAARDERRRHAQITETPYEQDGFTVQRVP